MLFSGSSHVALYLRHVSMICVPCCYMLYVMYCCLFVYIVGVYY